MTHLTNKTVVISGGSRGIGHTIATTLASHGANIVLLAKTSQPHPTLAGTVHTAVKDIEEAGGKGLAVVGDVRRDEDVERAVREAVKTFGGIDILVNNASAIDLTPTEHLAMKSYDLMHDINVRGTFLLSKTALPHLRTSATQNRAPHILTLSPPLNLDPVWFGEHLAYTMSKYGMSMTTLGLAQELKNHGVMVNSLWPATLIDTAAVRSLAQKAGEEGKHMLSSSRTPQIVADAAIAVLTGAAKVGTGNFLTDEVVLKEVGVEDFSGYATDSSRQPAPDIFL